MKKLNKKGFTLIELLAVIAILAILIVIAVPGVLEMYNKGRESAFISQAKNIWSSIETKIVNDAITSNEPYSKYCFAGEDDVASTGNINLGSKNYYYNATIENGEITNLQVQQVSGAVGEEKIVYSTKTTAASADALEIDEDVTTLITCP